MATEHPDRTFAREGEKERGVGPSSDDYGKDWNRKKGINPLDGVDMTRLRDAMEWSRQRLDPFIDRHVESVRYFAGSRYGGENDLDKTPMNLMRLAIDVWLRQLAAQTPKSLCLTRMPELRTDAYELELATEHLLRTIRFGVKLSEAVRSALFSMGVMKVGISDAYLAEGSGFTKETGQPYADPVLFEDWLHDMNARNIEEWDWCGNKYRLPYEVVMENPNFDKKVLDMLSPDETDPPGFPGEGMAGTHKRTSALSSGDSVLKTEYRQHVELWDLWIPGDNLFVTLPAQAGLMPLQVREWEGPDHGPYHILAFSHVPGNVMPSAPGQHLVELQDLINRLFNQLGRQAERQKTLTIVDGKAEADGTGEAIMEGEDGQVIRTSHIDGVKEMKYGGVDQSNMAFVVWLREIFSYLGGNIDAMGGLAQQAGTLGQEQLLVQSSSEMIRDMQSKVVNYTEHVVKDLAWYMYTDPLIELPLTKRVEGFGDIPFVYTPEDRTTDFFEYNFQIQPYSLQNKGPQQRLSMIMELTQNLFLPLAPQMEQWGMTMNLQKLVELISKYSDLPEITEIISSEMPTQAEMVGMEQSRNRALQSPVTQRNYTRQNIPTGGTQANRDNQLMQNLMQGARQGG